MTADPQGQSPETKAWVARRDAAAKAIAAVADHEAAETLQTERSVEKQQAGHPVAVIMGLLLALAVLLGLFWFLMLRLECDPMWSDRGLSSACKHPAG